MSGSDETAEEARRLASERAFTAERFLASLDQGEYTGADLAKARAAERDLALPALRTMARQRSGIVRLNAARALIEFGDRVGGDVLIECLQSEDSTLRKGAIDRLSWLEFRARMRSPLPPFDADALLVALEPTASTASSIASEFRNGPLNSALERAMSLSSRSRARTYSWPSLASLASHSDGRIRLWIRCRSCAQTRAHLAGNHNKEGFLVWSG
jgi:hypothetical protein